MKKPKAAEILKATPEDLRLIATLTKRPVFERLDAGEVEIVASDDWSSVPEVEDRPAIRLPKTLYRKMATVSRQRHTTPDRLAARWLAERLRIS